MGQFLAIFAGFFLLFVVVLVVMISTRPAVFRLQRSATMNAAPETIFPLINDFHQWPKWSPWEKLDPGMKRTYSGAESGEGAKYQWAGNKKAGEGRMTITDSMPVSSIAITIEFIKPFAATNQVTFTLVPAPTGTKVTWTMQGTRNFMMKAFSLVVNMEKLVGPDFERGLANLKSMSESPNASA